MYGTPDGKSFNPPLSGWFSASLFLCAFCSIASEKRDRNAKIQKKKDLLCRFIYLFIFKLKHVWLLTAVYAARATNCFLLLLEPCYDMMLRLTTKLLYFFLLYNHLMETHLHTLHFFLSFYYELSKDSLQIRKKSEKVQNPWKLASLLP